MNLNSSHQIEGLVSIIMPSYNSAEYINGTISSVQKQTYTNWELIIVDDYSTDETINILNERAKKDKRIKCYRLRKNLGAAVARNTAVKHAKGEFLAFLDSDDIWMPEKLEKQICFMRKNGYEFTATAYNEIEEESGDLIRIVTPKTKSDYDQLLKNCPGNSTIMYNAKKLGKFTIPDIKRRNDFVMWLKVIKKAEYVYGMNDILTTYRVREGSLSKDKKLLVKYQWKVYREIEGLSFFKSVYLLFHKITQVIYLRIIKKT